MNDEKRKISLVLIAGIFILPFLFSWFTLRKGYSTAFRVIAFAWLAFAIYIAETTVISPSAQETKQGLVEIQEINLTKKDKTLIVDAKVLNNTGSELKTIELECIATSQPNKTPVKSFQIIRKDESLKNKETATLTKVFLNDTVTIRRTAQVECKLFRAL